MPSLSSYDVGKKSFEGRRYRDDIEAAHAAMEALLSPLEEYNANARRNHKERFSPRRILLLGNHENRINRATENDPKLDGVLSTNDLKYEEAGWEVVPFLDVRVISNIAFSHYFTSGVLGRPVTSVNALLTKKHMSCVAGHQQGLQFHADYKADGTRITGIIAGSCLAPWHKVLTADLRYIPLLDIKVGDKLVSFDEHLGMSSARSRRYKTGTVTNVRISKGEMFDVTLSSGKVFRSTKDHLWLTNNCMGVRRWQQTQNLKTGVNGTKINRLFDEWEESYTYDAGWLAGMYDGEGSLYSRKTTGGYCTQLAISQSESHNPALCDKLVKLHDDLGFKLNPMRVTGHTTGWRISGGQSEIARFIGTIRPDRILSKFTPELLGNLTSKYPKELEHIVSVVPVGEDYYVEIEIDATTMIVEGYPHHNCYEHNEDYMGPQGNKHFRGIVMLHEVEPDGSFDMMPVSLRYLKDKYE